jgi:hypothetical protein
LKITNLTGWHREAVSRLTEYLTVEDIAAHYKRTIRAIYRWRERGIGPRSVKVNGRVLYPRDEVERYDDQVRREQLQDAAR